MIAPQAWQRLQFIGAPQCDTCGVPFDFAVAGKIQCAHCLNKPPLYGKARAALVYNDASRDRILKFKHADQVHAVQTFVPWLMRTGSDLLDKADVIVPVPLHRFRLLRRRYNQAAVLAGALARHTGKTCLYEGLVRAKATPSQGHLNFKQRHKNVKNAFGVNPACIDALKNRHVLLIDDVHTTGATIKECTKALLKQGADRVDVLAVARVVRPDSDL